MVVSPFVRPKARRAEERTRNTCANAPARARLRERHPLEGLQPEAVYVVGRRASPDVPAYRDFLTRNNVPFQWIDVERDPLVGLLGARGRLEQLGLPLFLFPDGSVLEAGSGDDHWAYARTHGATSTTS
jgi:hypothetical protein